MTCGSEDLDLFRFPLYSCSLLARLQERILWTVRCIQGPPDTPVLSRSLYPWDGLVRTWSRGRWDRSDPGNPPLPPTKNCILIADGPATRIPPSLSSLSSRPGFSIEVYFQFVSPGVSGRTSGLMFYTLSRSRLTGFLRSVNITLSLGRPFENAGTP